MIVKDTRSVADLILFGLGLIRHWHVKSSTPKHVFSNGDVFGFRVLVGGLNRRMRKTWKKGGMHVKQGITMLNSPVILFM